MFITKWFKKSWIKKYWLWILWLIFIVALGSYFSVKLFVTEDKSDFLIGEATYGHYQIEMACSTCHTDAFGGKEVLQDACVQCHAADLDAAHDSHPKKKFTDPRNADRIAVLDARYCISCHTEHQQEQTRAMGVTLPDDYCYHCHVDIAEERESHKDLTFDSCASAGCHNFHDNRALYEAFLVENADQAWLLEIASLPPPNATRLSMQENIRSLTLAEKNNPPNHADTNAEQEWAQSSHAAAGVNCMDCHSTKNDNTWIAKPNIDQCQTCHENEALTFTEGKHGMRLAKNLGMSLQAISPADSHMSFRDEALQKHQSCTACHSAHTFDREFAAVEACLACHNDEHSLAFNASAHAEMWQTAVTDNADTSQLVSCASCHMPRILSGKSDALVVRVNHNQNFNLRPNEKMIRSVYMHCHGLSFAINSLADDKLVRSNFNGKPTVKIPSIEWALRREKEE